jgi:hypothetical protein
MRRVWRQDCPACGSKKRNVSLTATIAPWVRELAQLSVRRCTYVVCANCDSGWSNLCFTEDELNSIYQSYRGVRYQAVREKWEPTYTARLNKSLDSGDSNFRVRIAQMESLVSQFDEQIPSDARCILDIGGGHGSLIPDWPKVQRKIVFDVSVVDANHEIERITSWNQIGPETKIDLVLNCMVLEHLNDPLNFLIEMRSNFLKNTVDSRRTLFYFEVPDGIPIRKKFRLRTPLILALSRSAFVWRMTDRLAISKPHMFPLRIAEHVQFFSGKGFKKLLERAGFLVVAESDYEVTKGLDDVQGIRFSGSRAVLACVLE